VTQVQAAASISMAGCSGPGKKVAKRNSSDKSPLHHPTAMV
jgi:hypothetical protein